MAVPTTQLVLAPGEAQPMTFLGPPPFVVSRVCDTCAVLPELTQPAAAPAGIMDMMGMMQQMQQQQLQQQQQQQQQQIPQGSPYGSIAPSPVVMAQASVADEGPAPPATAASMPLPSLVVQQQKQNSLVMAVCI